MTRTNQEMEAFKIYTPAVRAKLYRTAASASSRAQGSAGYSSLKEHILDSKVPSRDRTAKTQSPWGVCTVKERV